MSCTFRYKSRETVNRVEGEKTQIILYIPKKKQIIISISPRNDYEYVQIIFSRGWHQLCGINEGFTGSPGAQEKTGIILFYFSVRPSGEK